MPLRHPALTIPAKTVSTQHHEAIACVRHGEPRMEYTIMPHGGDDSQAGRSRRALSGPGHRGAEYPSLTAGPAEGYEDGPCALPGSLADEGQGDSQEKKDEAHGMLPVGFCFARQTSPQLTTPGTEVPLAHDAVRNGSPAVERDRRCHRSFELVTSAVGVQAEAPAAVHPGKIGPSPSGVQSRALWCALTRLPGGHTLCSAPVVGLPCR